MRLQVLASGSSGNASFLELGGCRFLIDAGISCRRIESLLQKLAVKVTDLDGVFITHEHRDHVAGLATLYRKYRLPFFTRPGTWKALAAREECFAQPSQHLGDRLSLGSVQVEIFDVSHDAAEPVGFVFRGEGVKCVFITDLGKVTAEVLQAAQGADVMVLEANYDPQMLESGPYPAWLKARIRGSKGHLSNQQSGGFLSSVYENPGTKVFLAHISQENNYADLAISSIAHRLREQFTEIEKKIQLFPTYPDRMNGLEW